MNHVVTAPKVLKLRDAAAYIGVSPATMRRLISAGRIKRLHYSRHILVLTSELDRFVSASM